jgi:hypothetical protein
MTYINVAEQFSRHPIGRYLSDGNSSGEAFRLHLLLPALEGEVPVVIVLDGVAGYPSSFLEEAFGGLVRNNGFTPSVLRQRLELRNSDTAFDTYKDEIWTYIEDASKGTGRPKWLVA